MKLVATSAVKKKLIAVLVQTLTQPFCYSVGTKRAFIEQQSVKLHFESLSIRPRLVIYVHF